MQRTCMRFLQDWLISTSRKPLVIRGARQVGKTWAVRELARLNSKTLIEINFEKNPHLVSLFATNDPQRILLNISAISRNINPEETILFLDEIQAAPELLATLRWFAEDMPELAVIATGSLLEFVLEKHTFSMPVGRIQYMYLEPLSFEEFLLAKNKSGLLHYIKEYQLAMPIPLAIHEELISIVKEYIIIGGMPEAVLSWITKNSLMDVNQVHNNLIATYKDDFNKYNGRLPAERLHEVIAATPFFLGEKFIYSKVNPDVQSASIKQALDLLCKARVCHKVFCSAGNGIPLAAELHKRYLKALFLDVGLCSALLGITFDQLSSAKNIHLINIGGISEQLTGQILRTITPLYIEPALYYWQRNEKDSNAEVDYLVQHKNFVVPLEVKAGSTGSLKSLHLFMQLKHLSRAVRVNTDMPSTMLVKTKDHLGNPIEYELISIPYYLLGELHRIL